MRKSGFSTIEIILLVAVIGLLAAVGYLFVQSAQKQQGNDNTAVPTHASKTTKPESTDDESKAALENVQAFYKKFSSYANGPDNTSHLDQFPVTDWVKQNYVTQAAADQYNNNQYSVNLVTCSQNVLPYDKYTFATPAITGTTGTVHITGNYEIGGETMIMVSLVKDGTTWKIDKFSCTM